MHAAVISRARTLCLVKLGRHACMAFCGHECSLTTSAPSAQCRLGPPCLKEGHTRSVT